jgi:hypothetical protein
MRGKFAHPDEILGKIIVLNYLNFMILTGTLCTQIFVSLQVNCGHLDSSTVKEL